MRGRADQGEGNPERVPGPQRVKVLFVPQWYPKGRHQFLGTFCREHAHAAALYNDVAVLMFSSRADRWPTMHWNVFDDGPIRTFDASYGRSPLPKTTLPVFLIHLRRALRRAFKEWGTPDVVHTQDAYAYYVMKALQPVSVPVVISQHWTVFMERRVTKRMLSQFRWAFARAARVLPDNKFAQREYDFYGIPASVTWLPNTIATDVFAAPPSGSQREPWLLHVSGMTYQKRVPDLIEAFAHVRHRMPHAMLHLVGDGQDRAAMQSLAERKLPRGSFHFHGALSKAEIAELMRRSSGFVLPSEAENMPCVLIEAMACGCPVLTTRVGGITALVKENEGLLVDVGNIVQITEGMCQLLSQRHGLDMDRISEKTRDRFSRAAVGRILDGEYRAARRPGATAATFPHAI